MQLLKDKKVCCALFCTLFLIYYLFSPVNHYLAEAIREGFWFRFSAPLLLGVILCMQIRKGKAFWVLLGFWGWVLITRVLNGDPALTGNLSALIELCLMMLLFAPGFLLEEQMRWRFFLAVAWLIVLFYFILGALTVYSAAADQFLMNPIDEYGIGYVSPYYQGRIEILSMQPNIAAGEFLFSFCFLIILFFRYRSLPLRLFLAIGGFVDAVVISLTISRNGQTFFCVALGLAAGLLLYQRLNTRRLSLRLIAFFLAVLVIVLITYQVFEPLRYGVWLLRKETASVAQEQVVNTPVPKTLSAQPSESLQSTESQDSSQAETGEYRPDSRSYLKSGRKQIFWSAIKSLEMEPVRLLIGCSYEHKMDISHELIREWAHHFHNMFLEIINLFGIPGLFLVFWLYWLLLKAIWRVVFLNGVPDRAKQLLFIPVLVITGYYMLEAGLFTAMDLRSAEFFFISGTLMGIETECRPETVDRNS